MKLTAKGQRTEAALLSAARQVFAEKGYFNAKISDIASAAGRSPGSFYNYYENKEQLLSALLEEFTSEIVASSWYGPGQTPEEGVRSAVRAYWNTYREYQPEMIGLFQLSMTDPEYLQRWKEIRAVGIETVHKGLQRAQASGYQIDLPLDTLASALVSLLEGFCWTWLGAGGDPNIPTPDDKGAIDVLTAVWYRTVYRKNLPS